VNSTWSEQCLVEALTCVLVAVEVVLTQLVAAQEALAAQQGRQNRPEFARDLSLLASPGF
jgi:hypothetical protein